MTTLTLYTNFIKLNNEEFYQIYNRNKTKEDTYFENDIILFNTIRIYLKEFLAIPHSYLTSTAQKFIKPIPFNSPLSQKWIITDILILERLDQKISKRAIEDEIEIPLNKIQIVDYNTIDRLFSDPNILHILDIFKLKNIQYSKLILDK